MKFNKIDKDKGTRITEQVIFLEDLFREKETIEARLKVVDEMIAKLK